MSAGIHELSLHVSHYSSPTSWRWRLSDDDGTELVATEVRVSPDEQYIDAFCNLERFLKLRVDMQSRFDDMTWWLQAAGDWISESVLGDVAPVLRARAPAVVRVVLPPGAEKLATRPFELARVDGRTLAENGIVFVFDTAAAPPPRRTTNGLRVLGIFSSSASRPIDVGAEADAMRQVFEEVSGDQGLAVDFRAVRYGAGRMRLQRLLADDASWDIVHIASHHDTGGIALDGPHGDGETLPVGELTTLLRACMPRLQLVVLSNCRSASAVVADLRARLQPQADIADDGDPSSPSDQQPSRGDVNTVTSATAGVPWGTLAMRYEVGEEFAVPLTAEFYRALLSGPTTPTVALSCALPRAAAIAQERSGVSNAALGIPVLFGSATRAWRPVLHPTPAHPPLPDTLPARAPFVGRTRVMCRANAALANDSAPPTMFVGMAGAGKSACALELAHEHRDDFDAVVWYQPSEHSVDHGGEANRLLAMLDARLDLPRRSLTARFDGMCAAVRQALARRRILVVLDNMETLVDATGRWQDPRWETLLSAILHHGGRSRALITARVRVPAPAPVEVATLHALSLGESLLLARRLPAFAAILASGGRTPAMAALMRRILDAVRGHPKLIELAHAALRAHVADTDTLEERLRQAERVWRERLGGEQPQPRPEGTRIGETADAYLDVLSRWSSSAMDDLPDAARAVLVVLALLEEDDRRRPVLVPVWEAVRDVVAADVRADDLPMLLGALTEAALVEATDDVDVIRIHPVIAACARATEDARAARDAVDNAYVDHWFTAIAPQLDGTAPAMASDITPARLLLAPLPYLLRRGRWPEIMAVAEQTVNLDATPASVDSMAAALEVVVDNCEHVATRHRAAGVLATVLRSGDPSAAIERFREIFDTARRARDDELAALAAHALADTYRFVGSVHEALQWARRSEQLQRDMEVGPWTALNNRLFSVMVRVEVSDPREVLERCVELDAETERLPAHTEENETVSELSVRSSLYNTASLVAFKAEQWHEALEWNGKLVDVLMKENAGQREIDRMRINDARAYIELDRLDEAERLAWLCKDTFERCEDFAQLNIVFDVLASVETARGHTSTAIRYLDKALRYAYREGTVDKILAQHFNLANALAEVPGSARRMRAHGIAAAVLAVLHDLDVMQVLMPLYGLVRSMPEPPAELISFTALCDALDEDVRSHFRQTVEVRAAAAGADGNDAIAELRTWLAALPAMGAARPVLEQLAQFDDRSVEARQRVMSAIDALSSHPRWTRLAQRLAWLIRGERDGHRLKGGLDAVEASFLMTALSAIDPENRLLGELIPGAPGIGGMPSAPSEV